MTQRHRHQRVIRSRQKRNLGFALIGSAVLVAVVVWNGASRVHPLLGEDLCPVNGELITGTTIVLVDATDPWTPLRQTAVAREMSDVANAIPRHSRVILQTVRAGSAAGSVRAPDAICNPGTVEQVEADAAEAGFVGSLSLLITNTERARTRYDTAFARVIDSLVAEAGRSEPQAESPILETLRSSVLGQATDGVPHVILISDLYQHSQLCSLYREPSCLGDAERLADPTVGGTHDLRDATVEVFLLSPASGDLVHRDDLLQFWYSYFSAQGALITRIKRIEE